MRSSPGSVRTRASGGPTCTRASGSVAAACRRNLRPSRSRAVRSACPCTSRLLLRPPSLRASCFADRIADAVGGLPGRTIGLLGLAFKAGTDDIRNSPAIRLTGRPSKPARPSGRSTPAAGANAAAALPDLQVVNDPELVVQGADAVVIATEWPEFRVLPWERWVAEVDRRSSSTDGGCSMPATFDRSDGRSSSWVMAATGHPWNLRRFLAPDRGSQRNVEVTFVPFGTTCTKTRPRTSGSPSPARRTRG